MTSYSMTSYIMTSQDMAQTQESLVLEKILDDRLDGVFKNCTKTVFTLYPMVFTVVEAFYLK